MKSNYIKGCPYCGNLLEVEDIDFNFKGNQDEYLYCFECDRYFLAKIRYNKLYRLINR